MVEKFDIGLLLDPPTERPLGIATSVELLKRQADLCPRPQAAPLTTLTVAPRKTISRLAWRQIDRTAWVS